MTRSLTALTLTALISATPAQAEMTTGQYIVDKAGFGAAAVSGAAIGALSFALVWLLARDESQYDYSFLLAGAVGGIVGGVGGPVLYWAVTEPESDLRAIIGGGTLGGFAGVFLSASAGLNSASSSTIAGLGAILGAGLGYWNAPGRNKASAGALLQRDADGWCLGVPVVSPAVSPEGEATYNLRLLSGVF